MVPWDALFSQCKIAMSVAQWYSGNIANAVNLNTTIQQCGAQLVC